MAAGLPFVEHGGNFPLRLDRESLLQGDFSCLRAGQPWLLGCGQGQLFFFHVVL